MVESEIEIPTATEIHINIAEPIIAQNTRYTWKMPFYAPICAVALAMVAFLMFVFWNQRRP